MTRLTYLDEATFVKVTTTGYGNNKVVQDQEVVPVIFLQSTGFAHVNNQDAITADAICYPDPENAFIIENANRLEGMYLLAPFFDGSNDEGWYKIESVSVNRDHLLTNTIDNIQCLLKKTRKISNVS